MFLLPLLRSQILRSGTDSSSDLDAVDGAGFFIGRAEEPNSMAQVPQRGEPAAV